MCKIFKDNTNFALQMCMYDAWSHDNNVDAAIRELNNLKFSNRATPINANSFFAKHNLSLDSLSDYDIKKIERETGAKIYKNS